MGVGPTAIDAPTQTPPAPFPGRHHLPVSPRPPPPPPLPVGPSPFPPPRPRLPTPPPAPEGKTECGRGGVQTVRARPESSRGSPPTRGSDPPGIQSPQPPSRDAEQPVANCPRSSSPLWSKWGQTEVQVGSNRGRPTRVRACSPSPPPTLHCKAEATRPSPPCAPTRAHPFCPTLALIPLGHRLSPAKLRKRKRTAVPHAAPASPTRPCLGVDLLRLCLDPSRSTPVCTGHPPPDPPLLSTGHTVPGRTLPGLDPVTLSPGLNPSHRARTRPGLDPVTPS